MKNRFRPYWLMGVSCAALLGVYTWSAQEAPVEASSHREAPLIADDPLADNTDLYAFRDPTNSEMINIIANYIPLQLPQGGPNYYHFGENVRYEIHVKNSATTTGDDIVYRFTFTRTNQDPSTFFNVRLGQENLKTTYVVDEIRGGTTTRIISNGVVPVYNIGPRSIRGAAGLNAASYETLASNAIQTASNNASTKIFCGPVDDPFFTDIGGIFDLGGVRVSGARDGLARKNVSTIALQIPISRLQKDSKTGAMAANILDPDYVIGVWATASRPAMRTLNTDGTQTVSGNWVQVSRIGMPLTNEVITNIGNKDEWNSRTPYAENRALDERFVNPELGLYMADNTPMAPTAPKPTGQTYYGEAVPGLMPLRIQSKSLAGFPGLPAAGFDFRNGAAGLSGLTAAQRTGTVFADPTYGPILLQAGKPRSVDILPIFMTGVPNAAPYQLATGKAGNPLAAGKPFINNFLPTLGDMLRLNMAVPATPRTSADFSSLGLIQAAVLGLTDARYTASGTTLMNIPNMDGFPNGRRLEDDVTRIELQAVGGAVLAAIGLWYDDYTPASTTPVTPQLGGVLGFRTGIEANDTTFRAAFPYVQTPWSGVKAQAVALAQRGVSNGLGLQPELAAMAQNYPNPFVGKTTIHYEARQSADITITITDLNGRVVATPVRNKAVKAGSSYDYVWEPKALAAGMYVATLSTGTTVLQSIKMVRQ